MHLYYQCGYGKFSQVKDGSAAKNVRAPGYSDFQTHTTHTGLTSQQAPKKEHRLLAVLLALPTL